MLRKLIILLFVSVVTVPAVQADVVPKDPVMREVYAETLKQVKYYYNKGSIKAASSLLEFARYHAPSEKVAKIDDRMLLESKITVENCLSPTAYNKLLCESALQLEEVGRPKTALLYYRVALSLKSKDARAQAAIKDVIKSSFNDLLKTAEVSRVVEEEKSDSFGKGAIAHKGADETVIQKYKLAMEAIKFNTFTYSNQVPLNSINYLIQTLYPYDLTLEVEAKRLAVMETKQTVDNVKYYYGPMLPTDKVDKTFKNRSMMSIMRYLCSFYNLSLQFESDRLVLRDGNLRLQTDMPRDGYRADIVRRLYEDFRKESSVKFGKSKTRFCGYIKAVDKGSRGEIMLTLDGQVRIYVKADDFIGEDSNRSFTKKKVFEYTESEEGDVEKESELDRLRRMVDSNRGTVEERRDSKKQVREAKKKGQSIDKHAGKNAALYVTFTGVCKGLDRGRLEIQNIEDLMVVNSKRFLTKWKIFED